MKLTPEQLEKAARAAHDVFNAPDEWSDSRHRNNWERIAEAAFAAIEPDPVEVPQDLVEAMCAAWYEDRNLVLCNSPSNIRAMTAALRIVLEDPRVLGDTDKDQIPFEQESSRNAFNRIAANRRARLLKPKTPEGRIRMTTTGEGKWIVWKKDSTTPRFAGSKEDAEIYRLGLIAKLKAEQEEQS